MEECDRLADEGSTARFLIAPPSGIDWKVCFYAADDAGHWGAYTTPNQTQFSSDWYLWTYLHEGNPVDCALGLAKNDAPSVSDDLKSQSTSAVTTGREYPIYRFGPSKTREKGVSGIYINSTVEHSTRADFIALAGAHHAIYRAPYGDWEHVAIISVSTSHTARGDDHGTASVKMEVESI